MSTTKNINYFDLFSRNLDGVTQKVIDNVKYILTWIGKSRIKNETNRK